MGDTDADKEWCLLQPKIELHAHLNGSIRDSTLLELARVLGERGIVCFKDVEYVIQKSGRSLPECFKLFDLIHVLATDHATITRITKEVIEDFASENVVYLELRTTPKNNEAIGMTKRTYMEAVIDGLRSVTKVEVSLTSNDKSSSNRKRIYVRLLLSIDRRESTKSAMETVHLALEMRNLGVVGIDLSGNPVVGKWTTFLPALKYAKEQGLATTLHCGEVPNREEIQAMLEYHPGRLGHVCCLEEDEWRKLKMSDIPVEICLTSNMITESIPSIDNHHFVDLYNTKHPLALCTDDAGVFSTSLSNEYYLAAATFGLGRNELFQLARNAIEYVFADEIVKKDLRNIFDSAERELLP